MLTLLLLVEGLVVGSAALALLGRSLLPATRWLLLPLLLNLLALLCWFWVELPRSASRRAAVAFCAALALYLAALLALAAVCGLGAFGVLPLDFGIFYVCVGVLAHFVPVAAVAVPYSLTLRDLVRSAADSDEAHGDKPQRNGDHEVFSAFPATGCD